MLRLEVLSASSRGTSDVSNRALSPGGLGLKVTRLSVGRKPHVGSWKVEADRRRLQGHPVLHRILSPMEQNTHVKDQVGLICFESWLLWQHQLSFGNISCLCYKFTSVIPTPPRNTWPSVLAALRNEASQGMAHALNLKFSRNFLEFIT